MATQRYPSVPAKTLLVDLASADTNIIVDDILDWNGTALTTASFAVDYIPATLINDAKTKVEFILIDATTIASIATTGATIFKRGLNLYGTGVVATDQTEVTAHKLDWTSGETKLLIGTNAPYLYGSFPNRYNDELITGKWTLSIANIWEYASAPTFTTDQQIITKKYADDLAIAGAADANTTTKGIVEEGTEAESLAGTDAGSTSARLFIVPSVIAKNIQNSVYSFVADAEASDTYAITLVPAVGAYATGQVFWFTANTVNTGAATLNVNALGAKAIKKNHDQDLENGDIESGSAICVFYDGTNFQMINQQATMPTTALLTEMATVFAATDISGAELETLSDTSNADALHSHTLRAFKSGVVTHTGAAGDETIAHGLGKTPVHIRITAMFQAANDVHSVSVGTAQSTTTENCVTSGSGGTDSVASTQAGNIIWLTDGSSSVSEGTLQTLDATNIVIDFTGDDTASFSLMWEAYG